MGGFEGGDEGGFWEDEENTFPYGNSKISNDVKYQIVEDNLSYTIKTNIFDGVITLLPFKSSGLTIEGYKSDIIDKAYTALVDYTDETEIIEFFHQYKIIIDIKETNKNDEALVGALFILLTKDVCNLVLNNSELRELSESIGADISQFI